MSKMLRWLCVPFLAITVSCLYAQDDETPDAADEMSIEEIIQEAKERVANIEEDVMVDEPESEDGAGEPMEEEVVAEEIAQEVTEPAEEAATEETPELEVESIGEEPEEPMEEMEVQDVVAEEEPVEPVKWQEDTEATEVVPETEAPKLGEDEVMGIDTVDIAEPQGNWLYKRVWWERAEAKFEKIREVVNKVLEERSTFFAKRAELDKNVLDPFYIKIGMSQGELLEILKELSEKVETLLADIRSEQILEKAEEDKKRLQELQKKVEQVMVKDEEVDNAIAMLVEQISKIRNIEQQAWQDFKNIARVLDDRKARELFYKVDAAWRNIKDLQQYIDQTFASRFDKLIMQVKEDIQRVDQEVGAIKESGTDLQQRVLSAQRAQQLEEEDEEEEVPKGFFTRWIIDPVKGIFRGIWSVITWPYYKIFGGLAEQEDEEEEQEEMMEPESGKSEESKQEVQPAEEKEALAVKEVVPAEQELIAEEGETAEIAEPATEQLPAKEEGAQAEIVASEEPEEDVAEEDMQESDEYL